MNILRIAFAVIGLMFWTYVGAISLSDRFQPGVPYYFNNFEPAMKQWDPGQDLNYEEVFKNYTFYEILFEKSGKEITVYQYIQNLKGQGERFMINPDGFLEKK